MRRVYLRGSVFLLTLLIGLTIERQALAQQPAAALQPPPLPIQQVRDELERVKKEFEALRQEYDLRLLVLEQRLIQLGGGPLALGTELPLPVPPQAPAAPVTPADPAAVPASQGDAAQTPPPAQVQPGPGASKVFNPDTSVIANFAGVGGKNAMSTQPSLQLTEAEVSLQAVIDPYARADFFLAAGPDGLEVEEGFITFTTLPAHLLLKVGKMRAQFGKVNALHTHAMPTVDRPLVTDNLVGGEEGLSDAGISVAKLIQNPFMFLEATGEVYAGNSDVFHSEQRSRLNYVGRLRAYRDLTEGTNLDFGTSYAFGPTDVGFGQVIPVGVERDVLNKSLIGFDATFRYRPLRRAIYKRVNLRTELIWSRQDLPENFRTSAFGFYGLGEYQFARRWYFGARIDRSGRVLDGSAHDNGGSVFLTYWPSEFSQIRTQFRRTNYAEGISGNEVLFQFNFAIGAHGAHVF